MNTPDGFVCDECRWRHPSIHDVGKTVPVAPDKHEEGQNCTGLLCRQCTYDDLSREQREATRESVCLLYAKVNALIAERDALRVAILAARWDTGYAALTEQTKRNLRDALGEG